MLVSRSCCPGVGRTDTALLVPLYKSLLPYGRHAPTVAAADDIQLTAALNGRYSEIGAPPRRRDHGCRLCGSPLAPPLGDLRCAVVAWPCCSSGRRAGLWRCGSTSRGAADLRGWAGTYGCARDSADSPGVDRAPAVVRALVPVRRGAWAVAVAPGLRRAYVTSRESDTVSIIDLDQNRVEKSVSVGPDPHNLVVDEGGGPRLRDAARRHVDATGRRRGGVGCGGWDGAREVADRALPGGRSTSIPP